MKQSNNNPTPLERRGRFNRHYFCVSAVFVIAYLLAVPVLAASPSAAPGADPLETINNLQDFIFSAIQAIGVIILAWGIVQIGMSLQSHDPSQRTNGFLAFFGGLVIAMSKAILDLILA